MSNVSSVTAAAALLSEQKCFSSYSSYETMGSIHFLPVDILLKICRRSRESTNHENPNSPKDCLVVDLTMPSEYIKLQLLTTLEPILRCLLAQVLAKDVLLKPHSSFNALDYLTLELYRNNPAKPERIDTVKSLEDINWVAEYWKSHPRKPLPLSWHLTLSEAATIIQKYWRGYSVRKQDEVQDLQRWQREWRLQKNCCPTNHIPMTTKSPMKSPDRMIPLPEKLITAFDVDVSKAADVFNCASKHDWLLWSPPSTAVLTFKVADDRTNRIHMPPPSPPPIQATNAVEMKFHMTPFW
ncbi:IQ domain containing protein K [Echinococcus multilocularis]|uniref:IQ domain containing protein K n=1 Tax=Echinococcus multilocularis TaxID=6211 RepID=A0A068Y4U2_ECHMU|nr:IQ domain containing protein K [Echinococcus multilocularis]